MVYCHPHSQSFSVVNVAEIDVSLKFPCFFYDPMNAGILISGFCSISKSILYIWKFSVHVVLNPSLKDFEHDLASLWNECKCTVVWISLALPFFEIWRKTDLFWSCGHCWVFRICWQIECSTLTALSFRIWNNSSGIPSPALALFIVMFPKAHLTSHSRMSGYRWVTTPLWFPGH